MDFTTEVELNTKQSNAIEFQAFIDESYQFINDLKKKKIRLNQTCLSTEPFRHSNWLTSL